MEVQAEMDRVAGFKGGHVNSSVLHGSQQRFPIKVDATCLTDLRRAHSDVYAISDGDIEPGYRYSRSGSFGITPDTMPAQPLTV